MKGSNVCGFMSVEAFCFLLRIYHKVERMKIIPPTAPNVAAAARGNDLRPSPPDCELFPVLDGAVLLLSTADEDVELWISFGS